MKRWQARERAERTNSDRAKALFLAEARRATVWRQNLLVTTGIFPKAPVQIFRVTAEMKPHDKQERREATMSREQAIKSLIEQMQHSLPLQ